MARLSHTLSDARSRIRESESADDARGAIARFADAGAQVGELQVECCAMSRMPLYAEILTELTKAQRAVTREFALGH
jgi:hypothetical protein